MNDVKLRDQRKPGWCWQDNELYDAFGPVIGPNAVTVYTHMTRNCYGTEIRCSSRELAASSGLSKDTVLRAMRVMERIRMLRVVAGGRGKVAECHLVDLKELAANYGGIHDWKRQSYVFSAQQLTALKALAAGDPSAIATVAVGDSSAAATVAVGDSGAPLLALGKPTTVSPEAHPYTRQQDKQDNPPTPQRGATDLDAFREKQLALAKARDRLKACSDCFDGRCTMNCGPAVKPAAPPAARVETGPDPPMGRRRRRWTGAMVGMAM